MWLNFDCDMIGVAVCKTKSAFFLINIEIFSHFIFGHGFCMEYGFANNL